MLGVHEVFHVSMLRRYPPDPAYVVNWGKIEVNTDGTFEEGPVCIMDSRNQVLQRKTVRLVRLLWQHRGVKECDALKPRGPLTTRKPAETLVNVG